MKKKEYNQQGSFEQLFLSAVQQPEVFVSNRILLDRIEKPEEVVKIDLSQRNVYLERGLRNPLEWNQFVTATPRAFSCCNLKDKQPDSIFSITDAIMSMIGSTTSQVSMHRNITGDTQWTCSSSQDVLNAVALVGNSPLKNNQFNNRRSMGGSIVVKKKWNEKL